MPSFQSLPAIYAPGMSDSDHLLDVKGLLCPLPVLKTRKRLSQMIPGETLTVIATDPASLLDMRHFETEAAHQLVSWAETDGEFTYVWQCADEGIPAT